MILKRAATSAKASAAKAIAVTLVAGFTIVMTAQSNDPMQARLKQLFPSATAFSPKGGEPPHFKAYSSANAQGPVVGYAFWTTDLQPPERGYDGPIKMLVGLDLREVGSVARIEQQ